MTDQDEKIQAVIDTLADLIATETRVSVLKRLGMAGFQLERALEGEMTGPERRDLSRKREPFFVRAHQRRRELKD